MFIFKGYVGYVYMDASDQSYSTHYSIDEYVSARFSDDNGAVYDVDATVRSSKHGSRLQIRATLDEDATYGGALYPAGQVEETVEESFVFLGGGITEEQLAEGFSRALDPNTERAFEEHTTHLENMDIEWMGEYRDL